MHIRKQRLLTLGPTPLYPPALHAMMRSDIHHRTENFRDAYKPVPADLKEVYGTTGDVHAETLATSPILALGEALKYVKKIGIATLVENTQFPARAMREALKEPGLDLTPRANGRVYKAAKAQPQTASA